MVLKLIFSILLGYLIGAIPIGLIVGKLARGVDIRDHGSGKMGSTNVLRTLGVKAGIFVLLADCGKGIAAVLLAGLVFGKGNVISIGSWDISVNVARAAAGLAAVVGHTWPIYIGFKGGRGVCTYSAALFTLSPLYTLFPFALAMVVLASWRYVSLASIIGVASSVVVMACLVALGKQPDIYLVYTVIGSALVIFSHRDNIDRLRSGKERRLGQREPLNTT
jgi:acyl phosphate:glycerol-3-phosphate acyltransferase